MREISSLQHPIVKHLVKLRDNKAYRYGAKRVLISGIKLIKELSAIVPIRTLFVEHGFDLPFSCTADEIFKVSSQIIKKVTGLDHPEPIAAEVDMPLFPKTFANTNYLLILDRISDPGNLGTLLRTALALGWRGVFLVTGSADPFNEKALRAAKGATFKLPWIQGNIEELSSFLRVNKIVPYAADMGGKPVSSISYRSPVALILGNEAHGIHQELKMIAQTVAIPMRGDMESLNVATAGAILMFEMGKTR